MSLAAPARAAPFRGDVRAHGRGATTTATASSPGITGWAQIHGLRGNTRSSDRVEFDNHYISNWSLSLDVKILFLTLGAVLMHGKEELTEL